MELRVMVRATHGRVVVATFAPDVIDAVQEAAADAMPPDVRHMPPLARCKYVAEKISGLMERDLTEPVGHAIAALAVLYAHLEWDGRADAMMRGKIERAFAKGMSPILGMGITGTICATCVSVDHERLSEQLTYLVERLAQGDTSYVSIH